jgi:transposase-like protein
MREKKGIPHTDPGDPPRRRANKLRGLGTWANDRPPIAGVIGRDSRELQMEVVHNPNRPTLQGFVERTTLPESTIYTDESYAYNRLEETGRGHETVMHRPGQREWARDVDGDGIREVHNNTLEGVWTGLRNFLRPFRGVSKWYEQHYVAIYQWNYNLKAINAGFVAALFSLRPTTSFGS